MACGQTHYAADEAVQVCLQGSLSWMLSCCCGLWYKRGAEGGFLCISNSCDRQVEYARLTKLEGLPRADFTEQTSSSSAW